MLLLSDGRIRVAGSTWVQYHADGTPDSTFGAKRTRFPSQTNRTGSDKPGAFDPDGKLVLAARYRDSGGDGDLQFAVIRIGRDDVVLGNDGTLWVDGTGGDDTITISPLNGSARLVRNGVTTDFDRPVTSIQLDLSSGNDVGSVSLDVPVSVQGGSGNDSITTAGGNDTILDSSGDDTIITGDGDDSVTDMNGSNSITTGAGNDLVVLCVATGEFGIPPVVTSVIAATVATGDGDDTVVAGGDVVASLGDGNDTFRPFATNLDARPGDRFNVDGGNGHDHLSGSPNSDSIMGGAGNDTIQGFHGDDAIDSGDGDDHVEASFGHDTIHGGSGADRIHAGYGNNLVFAGDGDDYIQSGTGNDTIWGEIGYDTIKAGLGDDYLNGGAGKDRLFGQQGNDVIYAGRNNDCIDGGPGRDLLKGGDGNDKLWDRDGEIDSLFGNIGDDVARVDDLLDILLDVETLLS
jgi:Ca2+-binding RTX toxin-like protein